MLAFQPICGICDAYSLGCIYSGENVKTEFVWLEEGLHFPPALIQPSPLLFFFIYLLVLMRWKKTCQSAWLMECACVCVFVFFLLFYSLKKNHRSKKKENKISATLFDTQTSTDSYLTA